MLYFTNLFFRELPNGSKFRKFGVGCQGQHTINLFASDTPCCFATSEKDVGSKPILQLHQCDNMQILFVIGYKKQKYKGTYMSEKMTENVRFLIDSFPQQH